MKQPGKESGFLPNRYWAGKSRAWPIGYWRSGRIVVAIAVNSPRYGEDKMKTCSSCGMPMLAVEDFAGSDPDSDLCVHCGQDSATRGRLVSFAMLESKLGKADELTEILRENLRQTRALEGVTDTF